jgi:hypothetical protein
MKRAGIILRVSTRSKFTLNEHLDNIKKWLAGYKQIKEIFLITDISEKLSNYDDEGDMFFQQSSNGKFLKFKTIGVINIYVRDNSAELKKVISDNKLDGLIIYEIFNVLSTEMQFTDFDSVMVITNDNLDIVYSDHQTNGFESDEIDPEKLKGNIVNMISERFIEKLLDLDVISKP